MKNCRDSLRECCTAASRRSEVDLELRELQAGDQARLANSRACKYYLTLATGTDVTALEAILVSGEAFGTGKVNT